MAGTKFAGDRKENKRIITAGFSFKLNIPCICFYQCLLTFETSTFLTNCDKKFFLNGK